jgi:FKBP-type peptidyl-prolyl cis-trans isomerase
LESIRKQGFSIVKLGRIIPGRFDQPLCEESGKQPERGKYVTIPSTGSLENSCTFGSSFDRKHSFPFTLHESQVIKEWDNGVATFKVGNPCPLRITPSPTHGIDRGKREFSLT